MTLHEGLQLLQADAGSHLAVQFEGSHVLLGEFDGGEGQTEYWVKFNHDYY